MSLSRLEAQDRRLWKKYEPFVEAPAPWERKRQEQREQHWYERWKAGYRPKAWPKDERDRDDIRFDLIEKEN